MTESSTSEQAVIEIQATRKWVETIVVGMNFCPFAKPEFLHDRIRYSLSGADSQDALLNDLAVELSLLTEQPNVSTTLLIHPKVLSDFREYNDFLDQVDILLDGMDLSGVFQVASFHPDYRFAYSEDSDVENFTNRSPYPMLHLLREEQLEKAIEGYDQVDQIPARNIKLLQEMGMQEMVDRLQACLD